MSSLQLVRDSRQTSAQLLTVLAVSFGPFAVGLGKGYSSPALASLAATGQLPGHLAVTHQQSSWLASLSLLGALLGSTYKKYLITDGRFGLR